jgi:hypothetical protein
MSQGESMSRFLIALFCAATFVMPALAHAATSEVSPASFLVVLQQEVHARPDDVFSDIGKVEKWWNKDHSYSHDTANLSLQLTPGGCFCERWDGNAIVHATVIAVRKDTQVRLQGGLGPLQDLAVTGILTFTMAPRGEGNVDRSIASAGFLCREGHTGVN